MSLKDGKVTVEPNGTSKLHRCFARTVQTLVANMVDGVAKGFEKGLEISGVGYRVLKAGRR